MSSAFKSQFWKIKVWSQTTYFREMLKHKIVKIWNVLFNLVVNQSQDETLHLNIQSRKLVSNFITRCKATGSQSPALKKSLNHFVSGDTHYESFVTALIN